MFWLPCSQASYFFHKARIVIYTAVTYIYNRLWPALLGHMLCKLRNYRKLVKAESSASKEIALGTGASYSTCVYDCSAWGSLSCTRKNQFDHRQLSSRVFCKEKHSKHALSNTTQPLSTTPWAFKNQNESLNTWTSSGVNSWQTWHHTDVVSAEKESSQLKSDCRARCDSTASHRSSPSSPSQPTAILRSDGEMVVFYRRLCYTPKLLCLQIFPAHGLLGCWKICVPWCSVALKSPILHEEQWWQTQPPGGEKRQCNRCRDAKRAWF